MKTKTWISTFLIGSIAIGALSGCGAAKLPDLQVVDDKYRTSYEVFVYSFYDSDGDGIGDLNGLTQKLDYINDGDDTTDTDLGCNEIWLMPISPSPTYHKYDVTDYTAIDPSYGSMEDFDALIDAAHRRGIHVIIDFVMNHSSSEHPWFTAACEYLKELPEDAEPDLDECPYVDYYHFSRDLIEGATPLKGTNWYYEARFWEGMPDLNLQSDAVRAEFDSITDFWIAHGVDGFRLDAVTSYETGNSEGIIEELTWFNDMVKAKDPNLYIVGEAWTDRRTYAPFYASGVDSFFDFSFADSNGNIAKVIRRAGTSADFAQSQINAEELYQSYNSEYINAPFYTNHDTARGAGFYTGDLAQAQTKFAAAMNLLMQGNAFIYYGEELGMRGAGKDENKRAPMQWVDDSKGDGMCQGPANIDSNLKMTYGSLETQQDDPQSIYNFYKAVIRWRNVHPAIARGKTEILTDHAGNSLCTDTICAIRRSWEDDTIAIIYNISEEPGTLTIPEGYQLSQWVNATDATDAVTTKDGQLQLPPYSIALFIPSES
ncbi:MAG: alpha-amylase [Lachnospiraceae bacterium]|nr:alpha-amylase [Lachnospiraceae bacterium]